MLLFDKIPSPPLGLAPRLNIGHPCVSRDSDPTLGSLGRWSVETGPKANDMSAARTKLCLALEEHRRTTAGRVRTSEEFLAALFPHDATRSEDRVFRHMPREVRGPVLAAWGIRGAKAAVRDDDDSVQSVVHDSLVAGDLDHAGFEAGLSPDLIVRWIALPTLWDFWRGGKLTKQPIEKALVTGYELGLFDATWLLSTIESDGGKLRGTDVLAEGLGKEDLAAWVRRVHESGDGTPRGLLAALGWESVVSKTSSPVLVAVLDALAVKVGLVKPCEASMQTEKDTQEAAPAAASARPQVFESVPPFVDEAGWGRPGQSAPPQHGTSTDLDEVDDASETEVFSGLAKGKVLRPDPIAPPKAREPKGSR